MKKLPINLKDLIIFLNKNGLGINSENMKNLGDVIK